ncbi:hypothetical protein CCACVL1_13700 [Corchorus capsularis]|uniref:Uncharacterized protein n=1 Tax=Corchorus capsularis TaxID=210143 RepID=A0A1R3I9W6_COCAP|nr:hypothetical protein CCACVL1_13700 [Corchorus capsularis]
MDEDRSRVDGERSQARVDRDRDSFSCQSSRQPTITDRADMVGGVRFQ